MRVALGLACLASSTIVSADVIDGAEHKGLYLGADIGVAHFPDDARIDLGSTTLLVGDSDNRPAAWNLSAGYRFNRYLAWEVSALDLGNADADLVDSTGGSGGRARLNYTARGATTSLVGFIPLGSRWEALVRLGVMFTDVDLYIDGSSPSGTFRAHETSDSMRLFWGLGLQYHLNDQWRVKLEMNRYGVGDRASTGRANINSFMLGVAYRF